MNIITAPIAAPGPAYACAGFNTEEIPKNNNILKMRKCLFRFLII